ncbi:MAG: exodeoxyribonuclease VII small subunit [Rhodospirillales bacterium 12-71-4]|nr:MAG: exodeoxyribonuclease VII small subunit [Rhodospirillales bacterium 12-71-4]
MSTEPDTARPVATLSFEDALAELEGIVKDLESGRGRLEEAVAAYERGAALRHHCEAKLAEAEAKVQAIIEAPPGQAAGLRDLG